MFDHIPAHQRESAQQMVRQISSEMGVPYDRACRIIYWHAHRSQERLDSIEKLKTWLGSFHKLLRAFNNQISLQQLRRQGPALPQPVVEGDEC